MSFLKFIFFAVAVLSATAFFFLPVSKAQKLTNNLPAESGKFVLYKYQQPMGAENYEITTDGETVTLKTNFELNFVGDKVPVATTMRLRKSDLSPLAFESKGKTSTRTGIDAAIEVKGNSATIRSDASIRTEKVSGKNFTIAHPAPITPQMMLFRFWKLNKIKTEIPLLPGGAARVEFLGRDTINVGGRQETLERYCIAGVMWGCETVWFDKDQNLVALVGADAEMDRFEAIREGYETALPFFVQKAAEDAVRQLEKLNREIKPLQTGKFALVGGLLVDGRGGEPVADSVVLIENRRILAAGTRAEVKIPKDFRTVDASGKTVLPGLFDTHAHATQAEWFPASLAAGITTMRDAGNELEFIVPIRDAVNENRALGPRLLLAGYIDSGEHPLGKMKAETPEEARALVQKYKQNGFAQIKIYQSLKPDLIKVVGDEAHRSGMTVTGHVPSGMNIYGAIENGFDQVNHINFATRAMLPKNFKPQPGVPTKIVPESEAAQEGLKFLLDNKIVIEPTVSRSELNLNISGRSFAEKETGLLKAPYAFSSLIDSMGVGAELEERARTTMDVYLRTIKALHKAGVPLMVGTDLVVPGHTEFRELELFVKAGLTPMEAIQAATIVPARVLGVEKESGSIEAGKRADLILVEGNPLENISEIRKTKFVVTDGRMYECAALWQSAGFKP